MDPSPELGVISKDAAEAQDGIAPVASAQGNDIPYWFRVAAEINLTPEACERVFAALERGR